MRPRNWLFALQYDRQPHNAQHHGLQPGMLAQHDRHVANTWDISSDAADDVLFAVEITLPSSIQLRIVCDVIVAFRQ
jgi:hypothetical protein